MLCSSTSDVVAEHAYTSTRFLRPIQNLPGPFGSDAFGRRSEAFARFFGTPTFLIGQTIVVVVWLGVAGLPLGDDIWIALAWCVGILVVAYFFAMVTYRQKIA